MLASILSVAENIGLPLIFLFVMLETGCGMPFAPGEIAVLTGGLAAADHKLQLVAVIAVAAAGAIVGDNIGYVIGRKGGRRLLESPRGPFVRQRTAALRVADPFFERHGGKAVFYGRWLPVLRVFASWIAGGTRMRWPVFAFWNATGGISWAISIALLGYYGGKGAKSVINAVGSYGVIVVVAGIVGASLISRRRHRRIERELSAEGSASEQRRAPAEGLSARVEPPA